MESKSEEQKQQCQNLNRKPSIKVKKIPVVKQTLTSYKRMLKANPLLQYEEAGIDINQILKSKSIGNNFKLGTSSTVEGFKSSSKTQNKTVYKKPREVLMNTQYLKLPKLEGCNNNFKKTIPGNIQPVTKDFQKFPLASNKLQCNSKKTYIAGTSQVRSMVSKKFTNEQNITKPKPTQRSQLLRKSLSAEPLQSKKEKTFEPKIASIEFSEQSYSEQNLFHQISVTSTNFPIKEMGDTRRDFNFKTPSAYERRSVCYFTPKSDRKCTLFRTSTPAVIDKKILQEKLNHWLKSRGKEASSFKHLSCFGINHNKNSLPPQSQIHEENKENIEVIQEKSESFKDLHIPISEERKSNLSSDISEIELRKIAKEALTQLENLIHEDYPRSQCLTWLELIREKYVNIDDEPEYWECRAAIEQSAGNVGNAVEFYKTAIIQGAKISAVDKSLDQLLKKFSLLNINSQLEPLQVDKAKERIVEETRQVFISTIIQFAIQERKLRKKDADQAGQSTKLVVTPVRRSTRLSKSGYVDTPGVKLCMSIKEIDATTTPIDFKKNKALC